MNGFLKFYCVIYFNKEKKYKIWVVASITSNVSLIFVDSGSYSRYLSIHLSFYTFAVEMAKGIWILKYLILNNPAGLMVWKCWQIRLLHNGLLFSWKEFSKYVYSPFSFLCLASFFTTVNISRDVSRHLDNIDVSLKNSFFAYKFWIFIQKVFAP